MEIRLKAIEPVEGFSIGEVIIVFIARIILHLQLPRVDRSLSLLSPLSLDRSILNPFIGISLALTHYKVESFVGNSKPTLLLSKLTLTAPGEKK